MHRAAVIEKCLKLAGPLSRIDNKNAKNSQVRCRGKMPKVVGPRSQKNGKKVQDRGHGKLPKSRWSAVVKKCQKVARPQSMKNVKNLQVR